jgi:hypothetical protein
MTTEPSVHSHSATQPSASVPAKFLDFLGRKYAGRPLTAQELAIIQETWAMALVSTKGSARTIEEIVSAHATFTDPLRVRINYVRVIIHNTLKKMGGPVPPELLWAENPHFVVRIDGIYRKTPYAYSWPRVITHDIKTGTVSTQSSDVVRVAMLAPQGWGADGHPVNTTDIPLARFASKSSTVIAQETRAACKKYADEIKDRDHADNRKQKANLEQRIRRLQSELAELDKTLAIQNADEQACAEAITTRAHERARQRGIPASDHSRAQKSNPEPREARP